MEGAPLIEWPMYGGCLVLSPPGHSRWAFDIVALDPAGHIGRRGLLAFLGGRMRVSDVHGWGAPVLAPAGGRVVAAHDGEPDRESLRPLLEVPASFLVRPLRHGGDVAAMAGNHVLIESGRVVMLLAHLRRGSLRVAEGDSVRVGDELGELGNSGNSVAPHLHLQVMDGADPLSAAVVPFRVREFEWWDGVGWQRRTAEPLPSTRTRIRLAAPS